MLFAGKPLVRIRNDPFTVDIPGVRAEQFGFSGSGSGAPDGAPPDFVPPEGAGTGRPAADGRSAARLRPPDDAPLAAVDRDQRAPVLGVPRTGSPLGGDPCGAAHPFQLHHPVAE